MDIIFAGTHEEKYLLDYMAAGSTVAKLRFSLDLVRVVKQRNAVHITVLRSEQDVEQDVEHYAKQVRERVFKHAFKALAANRKY